jgi:DME family drug/metabolite transporter
MVVVGGCKLQSRIPLLFVLLAAMLWGTTGTAQTFAPENTNPIALGAIRLALGGLTLLIIVLFLGQLNIKNLPFKATLIAALSMAFYQPFFFSAVKMTGVAIGTAVAIGSAPILAGLLEWMFRKRIPSGVWWGATFLSIIGCLLLFINKDAVSVNPFGVLLALGAGLSFAIYAIVSKNLLKLHKPETVVAVVFTLSAVILAPFLFFLDLSWLLEFNGVAVSLHLGIFATAIAYLLFSKGLFLVPASTAVTLSLAEPLTAALLGVFLVGELLTPISWVGIGLLFLGITLLTTSPDKK